MIEAREQGHTPELRARAEAAARAQCRRWGCGTGRPTADPLLTTVAESFSEFAGMPGVVRGCPFEGVFRGDGWVQELQDARVQVADNGVPWPDALGRDLTAVDVQALAVLKRAENRLDRMKREQDEQEKKQREAERARRRGG